MAYDYHGTWENTANHQAPLYGSPDDPSYWVSRYNVDWTIGAYLDAGVAANQLLLGIPLYSRGWRGVGPADGLYQSAAGAAPGTWESGMFDYWDVRERLRERPDQYVRYWDAAAGVPYVYSPLDGGTFLTYEDRESVALKIDYVMEHELGGTFFWELSGDVRDRESPDCLVALAADRLLAAP
jgi:chitinase